jgi:hypothetical protein
MKMRCEDAVNWLCEAHTLDDGRRNAAERHVAGCVDCRHALHAVRALHAERHVPIASAAPGAMARALRRAAQGSEPKVRSLRGFWLGLAVGGVLAASIVLAVVGALQVGGLRGAFPAPVTAVPQVALAVNETRDVSIALDSPETLLNAEIRVVLTGGIGLRGYGTQRELRWLTNIDRGVNQLTLPIVAMGTGGGQLMVEVQHGDKRRTFIVDVQPLG